MTWLHFCTVHGYIPLENMTCVCVCVYVCVCRCFNITCQRRHLGCCHHWLGCGQKNNSVVTKEEYVWYVCDLLIIQLENVTSLVSEFLVPWWLSRPDKTETRVESDLIFVVFLSQTWQNLKLLNTSLYADKSQASPDCVSQTQDEPGSALSTSACGYIRWKPLTLQAQHPNSSAKAQQLCGIVHRKGQIQTFNKWDAAIIQCFFPPHTLTHKVNKWHGGKNNFLRPWKLSRQGRLRKMTTLLV